MKREREREREKKRETRTKKSERHLYMDNVRKWASKYIHTFMHAWYVEKKKSLSTIYIQWAKAGKNKLKRITWKYVFFPSSSSFRRGCRRPRIARRGCRRPRIARRGGFGTSGVGFVGRGGPTWMLEREVCQGQVWGTPILAAGLSTMVLLCMGSMGKGE